MTFEKEYINFYDTKSFSNLIIDYLNEDEKLKPFYSFPLSIEGFAKAIEKRKSFPVDRKTLTEVLKIQNKSLSNYENFDIINLQIDLITDEKTFTVTTGHQLNIFTGPLYFTYKIFSAINLAGELKKNFPEYNFVPVYWMASEDHDFEEISCVHLFDKKVSWQQEQKGASGNISTATMNDALNELKSVLGESELSNTIFNLFQTAYTKHGKLTDAMRYLVHHLFGKYGLVIIDASERKLKSTFAPVIKKELLEQFSFKHVSETTAELDKNYKSQVSPRELNLFYMKENFRERIEIHNSKYTVVNSDISFTKEEILNELENYPERFSPNVVLRPLYEESLMPDLAYVGGGAEVSYWMQYKAMFESQNIFFPVLVLRDSVMVIEKGIAKKIKSSELSLSDLFLSYDELVKIILHKTEEGHVSMIDESVIVEKMFDGILEKMSAVDPTLSGAAMAEKQKTLNALKALEDKTIKALKRKNETSLNQLKVVKEKLFPENTLQERYFNFSMFYVKYGDAFFDALKETLNPLEKKFIVLIESAD
ncbi:MAG: bacillithiol biosynthesis cysteine-adding enzyme BshC [Bacteroidia bacterium]